MGVEVVAEPGAHGAGEAFEAAEGEVRLLAESFDGFAGRAVVIDAGDGRRGWRRRGRGER